MFKENCKSNRGSQRLNPLHQKGLLPSVYRKVKQMKNNIATAAVDAVNKVNQGQVENKGAALVTGILQLQEEKKGSLDNIKEYQQELAEIREDVINDHTVLGTTLPAEGKRNANEVTIARVIEQLNKNKQDGILRCSTRLTEAVIGAQANVEALDKKIRERRDELLKLAADVVTVDEVIGD